MTFARSPVMPKTTSTSAGGVAPLAWLSADRDCGLVAVVIGPFRRGGGAPEWAQAGRGADGRQWGGPPCRCGVRHTLPRTARAAGPSRVELVKRRPTGGPDGKLVRAAWGFGGGCRLSRSHHGADDPQEREDDP